MEVNVKQGSRSSTPGSSVIGVSQLLVTAEFAALIAVPSRSPNPAKVGVARPDVGEESVGGKNSGPSGNWLGSG